VLALGVGLTGCAGSHTAKSNGSASAAGSSAISLDAACTAGQSEGALNFRDTTDPQLFAQEIAPFQQKYPGIKVSFGSQRPQDSVQSIVAQVQTKHTLDVDAIAIDMPSAGPLVQQGLIAAVNWAALGVPESDVLSVQNNQFVRTQRIALGLGYNTTKLKESDLPNTWQELVDPKWAGKVVVDPRGVYLSGLAVVYGEDKTVTWYKQFLSTDKPMVVKGATASLQKVISGEALLTTSSHDAEVLEQSEKGAPVAIKYLDVVPTQDHYAILVKDAPHPNAAKCFLGWWISADGGQAQQLKYEFKGNDTRPKGIPASAQLGATTNAEQADLQTKVADQLAGLTK
jgi:iron(III) transport system substrate-binding protein